MQSNLALQSRPVISTRRSSVRAPVGRRQVRTQALQTALIISGSTAAALALGRLVFLPFQKDNNARQVPTQNGKTYAEAGDRLAQVRLRCALLWPGGAVTDLCSTPLSVL